MSDNERERLINWAKQLADPNWCLSVPKEAKDVITQLVKELEPRTITTAAELEALPYGSAVQTSDASDVVVLRCEGRNFRNQSGCDLSVEDLWRYGTRPFTVIFEASL